MAIVDCNHNVFFYVNDSEFPDVIHEFFTQAIDLGHPMVLIMSRQHRILFEKHLRSNYIDPHAMESARLLVQRDATETLNRFFRGRTFNRAVFKDVVGGVITHTQKFHCGRPTWAYGEMVDLLQKRGLREEAIELEHMWNELAHEIKFSLLCGYELDPINDFVDPEFVATACKAHAKVFTLPREAKRLAKVRNALNLRLGENATSELWESACSYRKELPQAFSVLAWLRQHYPEVAQSLFSAPSVPTH